jgi:hypothetical protein
VIRVVRLRSDRLERLAVSAGYVVLGAAAIGLARFFVVLPASGPRLAGLLAVGLCLIAAAILFRLAVTSHRSAAIQRADTPAPRSGARSWMRSSLLLAVASVALISMGIEASLPHYDLAERYYDWFVHFDLARIFHAATAADLGRHWGEATVTTRTPLYNLVGSLFLNFAGDRLEVFQVFTAAVAWLWVLPFALLARRLVGGWAPAVTALAGLSPLVVHTTTYASSKGLVAFFALLALERYLALRDAPAERVTSLSWQFGLFSAATVMTHSGFLGFPLALFALFAWEALRRRLRWRDFLLSGATATLVALPWYVWAIAQYGLRAGVFGYPHAPYDSVLRWAFDRFLILPTSLLPLTLPFDRYVVHPIETYFLLFIGTATGMLGVTYLLRALAQNLNRRTRIKAGSLEAPLFWFAAGGIIVADLLHEGVVSNNAGTFCLPGLLALLLLALRINPLTRAFLIVSLVETIVFEVMVLWWAWSPAGSGRPNALAAQANHLRFLGQDTLPIGIILLVAGVVLAVICVWPQIRAQVDAPSRASSAAAA